MPMWRRHMRLGCLLAHRRMSRLCLLVGPGFLGALSFASWGPLGTSSHVSCVSLVVSWVPFGFVRQVVGGPWYIVGCLLCASGWSLGAFVASSGAS